jgi:hypothetical protein
MSEISDFVLSPTKSFFKMSSSFLGPTKLKLKHRLEIKVGESARFTEVDITRRVVASIVVEREKQSVGMYVV